MKKIIKITILFVCAFIFCMTGCSNLNSSEDANGTSDEEIVLEISETSIFLNTGEQKHIEANIEDVSYEVNNENVAVVDADGNVKAVGKGTTYLTVSTDTQKVTCGILVDLLSGNDPITIAGKSMQPVVQERELIKWTILQNWDYVEETGDFFFIQQYDTTPSDLIVTRLAPDGTETHMRFLNSGHGNQLSVEYEDEEHIYLWMNANGDIGNSHDSIMRVLWEDGGVVDNDAEHLWKLDGVTYGPAVSVDKEMGLVAVHVKQGTTMTVQFYDLESMLNKEPILIHSYDILLGTDATQMGYYSFQGICLHDGILYRLEGEPKDDIYLAAVDMQGNVLYRELVLGYETIEYREPEGVQVVDDVIHIGIGSGASGNRRANVFAVK